MSDEALLGKLAQIGVDTLAAVDSWSDSVELLAALDAIARSGASAVVKIDGQRQGTLVYTVVVSGGRLGEDFFRKDGSDLRSLIRDALIYYSGHAVP